MNATLDSASMTWSLRAPGITIVATNRELLFPGYMHLMLDPSLPKPDVTSPLEMHIADDLTFRLLRETVLGQQSPTEAGLLPLLAE